MIRLPDLEPEALHGLPGRFVAAVEPYSEAAPAALLASFLTAIGCCIGPSPRIIAGGVHTGRLHTLVVGRSSKARKGSSRFPVTQVFERVDPEWQRNQQLGGFGSGEAVVAAAAAGDPRVLVDEQEFGRVLSVAGRQGSTLTQLLRSAWDDGRLETRRRDDHMVVDGAHVSMLAHITFGELAAKLAAADLAGGTINRLLMVGAQRSKLLPHGAAVPDAVLDRLAGDTRQQIDAARRIGLMRYTTAGRDLWTRMYRLLSADDPPGRLGDAVARAEAQTLRLSIVYASADGSAEIDVPHLAAGYAVWRYCRDTAALIFPEQDLDDDESKLLEAVAAAGDAGLTGEQRRDVFARHRTSGQMAAMVESLERRGLIRTGRVPTDGRPVELVVATRAGAESAESADSPEPPKSPLPPASELMRGYAESAREGRTAPTVDLTAHLTAHPKSAAG